MSRNVKEELEAAFPKDIPAEYQTEEFLKHVEESGIRTDCARDVAIAHREFIRNENAQPK